MEIFESIEMYLSEKRVLGVLSESSVESRRYELNRFARFCNENGITLTFQIKKSTIISFLATLQILKITKKTLMFILSMYMQYLLENEMIIKNFAEELEKPKTIYPEADYLDLEEVEKLFQTELDMATPKTVDRNLLLMSLLFTLCLRSGEAVGLKIDDVRLGSKQLWIKRKGGQIAKLPLNDDIVHQFELWFKAREGYAGKDSDWVFLSLKGQCLTNRQARYIISNALKRADIKKRKNGCHLLRHSGATLRLKNGEDIKVIQFLLGHKTLATTEKYLHFNENDLKNMIGRSHSVLKYR